MGVLSINCFYSTFAQAFFDMGEYLLVGGTKECLVAEVAGGEETVMQAAAVTNVVPLAFPATGSGDIFRAFVGLRLFDTRQYLRQSLAVQVAVGVLQQVVVAEAATGHHVARRGDGEEVVLTVSGEHAARGLAGGNVAGNLHEVRLGHLALMVIKPQIKQFNRHLGIFIGSDTVLILVVLRLAGAEQGVELKAEALIPHKAVEFGNVPLMLLAAYHDATYVHAAFLATTVVGDDAFVGRLSVDIHPLLVVDGLCAVQREAHMHIVLQEEVNPFVGDQRQVSLHRILHLASCQFLLHIGPYLAVVVDAPQHGLSPVPNNVQFPAGLLLHQRLQLSNYLFGKVNIKQP